MKILFFLLIILFSSQSWSCKCVDFDPSVYVTFSTKVYVGKVVFVESIGDKGYLSANISVRAKYIGDVYELENVLKVDGNICHSELVINDDYLVFESELGHVNFCTMRRLDDLRDSEHHLNYLQKLSNKVHNKPIKKRT